MAELSIRYASALFDLAIEEGMLNEYLNQVIVVREVLQTGECRNIMRHPHIPDADKRAFLEDIFAGINDKLAGFLYLLITKSCENLIIPALTTFIKMAKLHNGKIVANIVSAAELNESQISAIKKVLSKKLGKEVEISSKTDHSLIGGFYINVEGCLVDCTIKKHLRNLKEFIKKEILDDNQS